LAASPEVSSLERKEYLCIAAELDAVVQAEEAILQKNLQFLEAIVSSWNNDVMPGAC
jgi:hypothetical protein